MIVGEWIFLAAICIVVGLVYFLWYAKLSDATNSSRELAVAWGIIAGLGTFLWVWIPAPFVRQMSYYLFLSSLLVPGWITIRSEVKRYGFIWHWRHRIPFSSEIAYRRGVEAGPPPLPLGLYSGEG